jgi:hypothetical protein
MSHRLSPRFLALVVVGLLLGGAAGCSSGGGGKSCAGTERCACYPNLTCNAGLTCLSNVCVNESGAGGSGAGGMATGTGGTIVAGAGGTVGGGTGGVTAGGVGGMTGGGVGGTTGGGVGGTTGGGVGGTTGSGVGGTTGSGLGGTPGGAGGMTAGGVGGMTGGGVGGTTGGLGGTTGGLGGTSGGGGCIGFAVKSGSTEPTVFLLVDRSGSMFQCLTGPTTLTSCADPTDTTWAVLKGSVLPTVQQLQNVIRFGFGAFTGEKTGVCPAFDEIDPSLSNYDAIATLYSSLGAPAKGETPTAAVLAKVGMLLAADTSPGPKYILFVTDGQPDYCDDGDATCPTDSVVWRLQQLKSAGVTTFVFGIQSKLATVMGGALQAFANAGAGQPVAQLTSPAINTAYECESSAGWTQDYRDSGGGTGTPTRPLGAYQTTGGTATVYAPDPTNPQALTDLLATTLSGVKSCTFDLADAYYVDLTQLALLTVTVQGQVIPQDATNGWSMASDTRLVLNGNACTLWRSPQTHTIDFGSQCGLIRSR